MAGAWSPKSLTPPRTTRQAAQSDWIFHHGTPDERTWEHGADRGLHVGTYEAARQALEATIGAPAEGEWDGTREYGRTPIVSNAKNIGYHSGLSSSDRGDPRHENARYSNGAPVPMDARPSIFPVRITGEMTNHPATAMDDAQANGRMKSQITRGQARRGYFYRNVGEDAGSVSAVVPSAAHLERVHPPKTAAHDSTYGWDDDETYALNHPEYDAEPPSASEEYWNPPHLYHGTSAELRPGDMTEGGHPSNFDKPKGRLPHAYATPHVSTAAGYAETAAQRRGGHPRVYEVDRAHDMLPDPETGAAFGISSETLKHPDWRSKSGFRVLRELHPSEFEHHLTEDWPGLHGHTAARAVHEASAEEDYWYHGTRSEFQPGHALVPQGKADRNNKDPNSGHHVYFTRSFPMAAFAAQNAKGSGAGHVYEVKPSGSYEDDPTMLSERGNNVTGSYRTKEPVHVVREVQPEDFEYDAKSKGMVRRTAAWTPSSGIFGPTTGLDPHLFDGAAMLRGQVRHDLMTRLDQCLRVDSGLAGSDWQEWLHVYLAGGSASEWAGSRPNDAAQDLDVIVAIDLAEAQGYSSFEGMSAGEAASALNDAFWHHFNTEGWQPEFGGTWNLTAFCNQRAVDITAIHPYAAYDVTDMRWAVKPPHLPEHSVADFSPALVAEARAVAAQARAILRLDEPMRTREARSLWEKVHADRSRAFSGEGEGWQDAPNVIEKWLAYAPHGLLGKIRDLAMAKTAAAEGPGWWKLYHGTNREFSPGDTIDPGHGRPGSAYTGPDTFASDELHKAIDYAHAASRESGGHPVVYQVDPVGTAVRAKEDAWQSGEPFKVVGEAWRHGAGQCDRWGCHVAAAQQNPPCYYCGDPLDDEDVRDGQSAHEECSDMRWCEAHQEHHDDPQEAEDHNEAYTDWGSHLPFEGGIHRGITIRLPAETHAVVHDESRPAPERAGALARHLHENPADYSDERGHAGGYGLHWTDHEPTAQAWGSGEGAMFGPSEEQRHGSTSTHVVMHAASPHEDHIEDDPHVLSERNLLGYDHARSEREVPLKASAPVRLRGISWKRGGEDEWNRHDFGEPEPKTAVWHHDTSGSDNHGVYLRFGDWPHNERSFSPAGGYHEEGVSAYDLDREGDPAIGHGLDRGHQHDDECDVDEFGTCQFQSPEGEPDNDPREEMQGRVRKAERNRHYGEDKPSETGHLVRGEMSGVGYDGEPLLKNVKRVGDWIDHRHLFLDQAGPHRLARDPSDEDYEAPEEKPAYGYRNRTAALEQPSCGYCGERGHKESEHCEYCGERGHTGEEAEFHADEVTEPWHDILPEVSSIHRAMALRLPAEDHAAVHDPRRSESDRAAHLMGIVGRHPLGMHWASDRGRDFAEEFAHPDHAQGGSPDGVTGVMVHAHAPHPSEVEDDPERLIREKFWGYRDPEYEVPLKQDAPVDVTGISWRQGHGGWTHHDFGRFHQVTAAVEDDDNEDPDRYVTCAQGHEHWGALGAAGLLVRHRDGDSGPYRYLLQKRSPHVQHGGTWSTPGGALQHGESPQEGAVREASEEGMRLPSDLVHHHTFTDDHGDWAYHTVVMDSPRRFDPAGEGESDWESEGHRWVTPQEAQGLKLHPGFAASWDKVRKSGAVQKTVGSREDQLAVMDDNGRASALAQEHVRLMHQKTTTWLGPPGSFGVLHEPVLTRWLADAGHPRASEAYVTEHPDPGVMQSSIAHGPDGEPGVALHPDRWDYGTLAHEAAHHVTDLQTGRLPFHPHGPGGVHDDQWAGNYAGLLNRISKGAGDDFLAERETHKPMQREASLPQPPQMPPRQQEAHGEPDFMEYRRKALDVARNPEPGTVIWRSEQRGVGEDPHPQSVGIHWTVKPEQVIHQGDQDGRHTVVYQGRLHDPDSQAIPRSHPMWGGIHRSMDAEAEVRLRPGASVHVEGTWVPARPSHTPKPGGEPWEAEHRGNLNPLHPERMEPGNWEWHPVGHEVPVRHAGQGAADYSDVGIEREAAAEPHPGPFNRYDDDGPFEPGHHPGPFLHGSVNRIEPGTLIHQDAMPAGHGRARHNYFTTDRQVAEDAADQRNGRGYGWIHRVEPTGSYETDHGEPDSWRSEAPLRVLSAEPGRLNGKVPHPPILREASSGLSFRYEGPRHEGDRHVITVHHPDAQRDTRSGPSDVAGSVQWDDDGLIRDVSVHQDFRRRGIATELFRRAQQVTPRLRHADNPSPDAEQWIEGMQREATTSGGVPQRPKRTPGSAMVYLDVPHGTVEPYEGQEGGHHVALAYLPRSIGDEDFERVKDRAREAAARHAPMKATLGGGEVFPPGTPSDRRRAAVVPVHAPGIHELHAEFSEFDRAHYETYSPHVTRAQLGGHQDDPPPHQEASFPVTHVHVRRGDEVHSFPLTGPSQREAAAEHESWYHITDNPHFSLDPHHEPQDNSLSIHQRTGQGIYLTKHPEGWVNGHGYVRPYVAEVHARPEVHEHDTNGRWGGEMFVPAEHFDKLHVHRVIPLDAHAREEYGEHGWIEDHHGTDFGTNEDLPERKMGWRGRLPEGHDYRYEGPDVRDMSPAEHARHRDRWLGYMKENRDWDDEGLQDLRESHDSHRKTAVSGYDGLTGRSGMIYLDLPPGSVRQVPGGVDDHHVTLVYLGKDVSDEAFAEACRRTRAAAARLAPMDGVLRGIDIFPPSKSSDSKVVAFVPAYIGSVGLLRRELEDLSASEHTDWRPHVTLAYLEEGDSLPAPHPAVPLRFNQVHVKRGDNIVSYPLGGMKREAAADVPTFYHGSGKRYREGDMIDPALPHKKLYPQSDPAKAYFSDNLWNARNWANTASPSGNGHVYEVEPAGHYEDDPHYAGGEENGIYDLSVSPIKRINVYQTGHPLRIVRKVPPE